MEINLISGLEHFLFFIIIYINNRYCSILGMYRDHIWLVVTGTTEFDDFPSIGKAIIPIVTHSIIFQRERLNHQPDKYYLIRCYGIWLKIGVERLAPNPNHPVIMDDHDDWYWNNHGNDWGSTSSGYPRTYIYIYMHIGLYRFVWK